MTAGTGGSSLVGNFALTCNCNSVLIDSEAVAARVRVPELEACWPDTNVEPMVLKLLGLRIEKLLERIAAQLGKRPSADYIEAIPSAVEAAWRCARRRSKASKRHCLRC